LVPPLSTQVVVGVRAAVGVIVGAGMIGGGGGRGGVASRINYPAVKSAAAQATQLMLMILTCCASRCFYIFLHAVLPPGVTCLQGPSGPTARSAAALAASSYMKGAHSSLAAAATSMRKGGGQGCISSMSGCCHSIPVATSFSSFPRRRAQCTLLAAAAAFHVTAAVLLTHSTTS
jgi:uncharacterized membrane protein YfcA